jgi:hypothetical protein
MASSVAMLQLDLADPDFRTETILGARAVRAHLVRDLSAMAMHQIMHSSRPAAAVAPDPGRSRSRGTPMIFGPAACAQRRR